MPYMSKATIMGHLGRDAEAKQVGQKTVTSFSIAVSDGTKDKPHSSWFDVEAWDLPDWLAAGLTKGALVLADGRLKIEEWEKNGEKRSKVKLVADSYGGVKTFEKRSDDGVVSRPKASGARNTDDENVPF
jgi:single-strand DNA-binding protein